MSPITPASELPESRLSVVALWLAVRKNWLLMVVLTALVGSGTAFYTLGQTKIYEASATIMFDPNVPRPLGERASGAVGDLSSYWNNKEYYTTQYWMIRSMRVASQVVRDLELNKDANFIDNVPRSANHPQAHESVEDTAAILLKRLNVEPVKDSRLTSVTYRDADPARAQRILGALVDTYAQDNLDDVFESATTAADWLRGQVGSLRQDLESSELALHQFKKDRNILSVSMDDQSNMLRGEMTQLGQALTDVRTRRERVLARLAELKKISPDNPVDLPARELMDSSTLSTLRARYVEAQRELEAMEGAGRGENHPLTKSARASLDSLRTALVAEVKNIQESCARDAAGLEREIGGLKGLYDAAERRALDLNLMEIEYGRLRRGKETNEKLFSLVVERSKETDLTRLLRINNVRVVDRPLLPKRPVTPNVPLNIMGGIAAGLVLGLLCAIGREQLDRTIKAPDEVERELAVSLLGVLPEAPDAHGAGRHSPRRRRGRAPAASLDGVPIELAIHARPTSGMAEAVRAIRTNIVFMSPDNPHHTLLVTSAAPAEGKTTVACAIATTIAQAGQRVVLVDCDLRRPRVHAVFKRSNDWGVTSALLEPNSESSIVFETEVPNLWIAPTGPIPPNPAELLHSEAFRAVLNRLRNQFDRVIIDSPPIVPVTDATVLSTLVDGVVVVVRASRTRKDLVRRAIKSLRDVGSRLVGVVLNAADVEGGSYGAYQYYSYRREGYTSAAPPKPAAENSEHIGSA
ncbi:MAG TPA: polysaccharide biosynthesis tyrosine autokinase [Polyangiaceae bacterium]|nr:polysaccharide biosynthesis tyrosine autokinase [Polyangiaceae bacterium]